MFLLHLLGLNSRATMGAAQKVMPLVVQRINTLRHQMAANPSQYHAEADQVRPSVRTTSGAVMPLIIGSSHVHMCWTCRQQRQLVVLAEPAQASSFVFHVNLQEW
jgi:hypothetical protein